MDFNYLIDKAIINDEIKELLIGKGEYEVEVSKFESDVFPTDVNRVLVNCFYKQMGRIENIDLVFNEYIEILLSGNAVEVYVAIMYFHACIFQEEEKGATFLINREDLSEKIKKSLESKREELANEIIFPNGMKKFNSWKNIENFNNDYIKRFGFGII